MHGNSVQATLMLINAYSCNDKKAEVQNGKQSQFSFQNLVQRHRPGDCAQTCVGRSLVLELDLQYNQKTLILLQLIALQLLSSRMHMLSWGRKEDRKRTSGYQFCTGQMVPCKGPTIMSTIEKLFSKARQYSRIKTLALKGPDCVDLNQEQIDLFAECL